MDDTLLCELLHPSKDNAAIPYSIAHAVLKPGSASLPHRLKMASEVYYILQGWGVMSIDGEDAGVKRGQAIYIPPGSIQHIRNAGDLDLEFLCIVHPFWRENDEEVMG